MEAFSGIIVFAWLLAIVLFIAWVVLPVAIIGTKPLLRELLKEQRRTNELLEAAQRARAEPVDRGEPIFP